jgi:hypothetical protein
MPPAVFVDLSFEAVRHPRRAMMLAYGLDLSAAFSGLP